MPSPQARYWFLTCPFDDWEPCLVETSKYTKGQGEIGSGGYRHWHAVIYFDRPRTMKYVKGKVGSKSAHLERTISEKAEDYVWKEETRIPNTQFEFGVKSFKRNNRTDWDKALSAAKSGNFEEIPADVQIRCYGNLRKIHVVIIKN